jgi:antitoxin component of MazEF toxin-antitoxin module
MRVKGRVRRVGNSLGIVIPKEEVKRHAINAGDVVELEIEKKTNLKDLFGSIRFSKETQELKEEGRRGWGE